GLAEKLEAQGTVESGEILGTLRQGRFDLIALGDGAGKFELLGNGADKMGIFGRSAGAGSVVEMNDVQSEVGTVFYQRPKQGDGIGAAGDGDAQMRACGENVECRGEHWGMIVASVA